MRAVMDQPPVVTDIYALEERFHPTGIIRRRRQNVRPGRQALSSWQVDLEARLALHASGFAVCFAPDQGALCPSCCIVVKQGDEAWIGCPGGVPHDLSPGEVYEWVRQGAYAFLGELHAATARDTR